jgi:hypothetical protein
MASLADLVAMKDALERARFSGTRSVMVDGITTEFKSDSEMKTALVDLNRKIASASGPAISPFVTFTTSKGV